MKKLTLTTILVLAFVLTACSGSTAMLGQQATNLLSSAADVAAQAMEEQVDLPAETEAPAQPTPAPALSPSDTSGLLAAYEGALENVYTQVNPSVVNIQVLQKASEMGMEIPGGPDLPFNFPGMPGFPGSPEGAPNPETPQFNQGVGSGFVWDKKGHIVTNNHVVGEADEIEVTFHDGTTVPAELVGADPYTDLAVIKIDLNAESLKPVGVADSRLVRVGQLAIAIGNPFGLEGTMTVGIVSALGRTMPAGEGFQVGPVYSIPDVIQTDAPINPGNSGGVLVDDQGQVIGVTFAIESPVRANAGIGFAIPASIVQRVVPALIEEGSYQHPYMGISGGALTPDLAEAMDLEPTQRGALITEVTPDGPADKAGLRGSDRQVEIDGQETRVGGDVIIAVNEEPILDMDDLIAYLTNNTSVGDQITVTVQREREQVEVEVTLGVRPGPSNERAGPQIAPRDQAKAWLGIVGGTLTPEMADAMELPPRQGGVLVEQIQAGSPADQAGLRGSYKPLDINGQMVLVGGDVIIALDGKDVETINDLGALLGEYEPGDEVTLTVLRDSEKVELDVTLGERPG